MHFTEWSGAMGWGWLWMIAWWVLPIVGIVLLVKWLSGNNAGTQKETPLEILKARFARGEIDQAEFERMHHQLEK